MELARRILGPLRHGIEIGPAAFAPFPGVRAWNLEHPGARLFQETQRALSGRVAPIDLFATAERLPLRAGALDFVLASHVIEHMPDTIRALGEWDRVLRPGGILFLIVPHRERNMDAGRPCTELEHVLADHALGTSVASDSMVPTSHYHVWRTADFLALVEHLVRERFVAWRVHTVEDVDSRAGNGFTVVLEKLATPAPRAADPRAPVAFHLLAPLLPFQVPLRSLERVLLGPDLPRDPPLPRGRYRAAAIRGGFPPAVARSFELDVGPALPAPNLRAFRWEGLRVFFAGEHLDASTWLEATYPDGSRHPVLPERVGAELCVDLTGLAVPTAEFGVEALNPPPGGGRSAALRVSPPGGA
ncbi:MAG: class I SAM-dependent methyltransferase [Planctomycetes bacterium]|nr:class I SAM-dependent methyltransferase [Planctomycetota bacterium]